MALIITKEHLNIIAQLNPCKDRFERYKVGDRLSKLSFYDAIWVENTIPEFVKELELEYPLWTYSGFGYGYGNYGYSYDSGSGSGPGSGDGSGSGPGSVDDYGSDLGSGSGYGSYEINYY